MSFEGWVVFVGIWTAASLPMGPNALNCVAVSASEGFAKSLWAVFGILIAALLHIAATLFGIAALLLANAELFQAFKFLGAAYLVWMGISLWRKKAVAVDSTMPARQKNIEIVRRSILISLTNPKAIIAYMAVFSQFIDHQSPLIGQMTVLVPTALTITASTYLGYCVIGRALRGMLTTTRRFRLFDRCIGFFYIAAGTALAVTDIRPSPAQQIPGR